MEASFLGIMLFGRQRVSNRVHLVATALVALGTSISAFWILALNSWMHTPAGFTLQDGQFHASDWLAIIFNPSFPYRFAHVLLASFLTSAFMIAGICAWRIRSGVSGPATHKVMKTGVVMAAVLIPLQIFVGDLHGLNTLEHQPAKIAAMEGVWETERGAPFTLFAWPDQEARKNRYAIEIPYAASMILTHEMDGEVRGLNEFADEHPPVPQVFWSFRVMLGVGMAMLLTAFWGAWSYWRRGHIGPRLLRLLSLMTYSGWVATLAGWYVTEIGRQPWMVYGLVGTAEVAAEHASATLAGTLFGYVGLYVFLLISYVQAVRYMSTKPHPPNPADMLGDRSAGATLVHG
jgi:cytochrome d ubiquinol oxidase subunit I